MRCEDAEQLIERRQLEPALPELAELSAHLADCADCRGYAELVGASSAALRGAAAEAQRATTWPDVEQRVQASLQADRRAPARMAVAAVVLTALIGWAAGADAGIGAAILGGLILIAAVAERRRRAAEVLSASESPGELLALYRSGLTRHRRRLAWTTAIELSMGTMLTCLVAVVIHAGDGRMPTRQLVFYAAWAAFLLGCGVYHLLIARPRLRAELAQLADPEGADVDA